MKIGFDNEKYLQEQAAEIKSRAAKYGKLYLEFGGKLMNDNHAARCLPGYDPNVKLRLLQSLGDDAELVLCIYAGDIEAKKMRADYGTTYEEETLKLIAAMKEYGISVRGVAITRFDGHPTARAFAKTLEEKGVDVFYHYPIKGYPNDLNTIVSDSGYGRNDYIPTSKPIVVVTGPGPGSGKFATCLTMLYHEVKRGNKAAYAKFETFPVWNLPLMHPVNVAYEAATLELKDENQIDPHHFLAHGEIRVNYNRDVEAYPILREIWERMMGEECPYKSPTDMGVNRIASGIVNDVVVRAASREECQRRYERVKNDFDQGKADMSMLARALTVLAKAD
ncbi:MAG: DUF1846 domain-containing protein [Kiritimatiellae bacterium]|nr:DUF1846 domain-containing protein [Kiritimatiellia bacterium]